MSFSNAAETAINNQIFVGTTLPWNANTELWLALCTADPGEAGTAGSMNEIAYTSYARVAITRASDLTVVDATVTNASLEQFPMCTGAPATATHVAIVTSASGGGTLIVKGILSASVTVAVNNTPQFLAGSLVFTLD